MVSDSITSSIPMASSNAKDLAKKKRVNRSAKLKQCKLDARREQWLSQVKNKDIKDESGSQQGRRARNERDRSMKNLEIKPGREENDGLIHHFSDSDSPSNSPTSHTSSVFSGNDSGTNFTGSGSRSSTSSSGGCCSESISDDDGGEDGECLDDWEAVADALADAGDKEEHETIAPLDSPTELPIQSALGTEKSKLKPECDVTSQKAPPNCRAWRSDDVFRPQSLPNLSKQHSFLMNSDRHCGRGGSVRGCKNFLSAPSSCPICYEDLDITDSSFVPCSCGFRLCLFCHKRILEEDGRCPGCRRHYYPIEAEAHLDDCKLKLQLARSHSMITRS